jgi:hypothetical protein
MPEYRKAYDITRMDWPPSSPDLNPIENVWALLKACLWRLQQDPPKSFNTEEKCIQVAQEEWEKLDWDVVNSSIDSINKRVKQVIKMHGGHTKF